MSIPTHFNFRILLKSFCYIAFLFLQLHSVSKLIKQSRLTQRGSCLNGCMSAMCKEERREGGVLWKKFRLYKEEENS